MTNCTINRKGCFLPKHPINMNKAAIKAAILESVSAELDQWLDKQETIGSGYEYEGEFMKVAQRVNKLMLEKSQGQLSGSRNKKTTPYQFWENRSQQNACPVPAHSTLWHQQPAAGNNVPVLGQAYVFEESEDMLQPAAGHNSKCQTNTAGK
jgi:hypothetical protein